MKAKVLEKFGLRNTQKESGKTRSTVSKDMPLLAQQPRADKGSGKDTNVGHLFYLMRMGATEDRLLPYKDFFNIKRSSDGFTPLHCAVSLKSPRLVKFLLENGADCNISSTKSKENTAFNLAKKIVELSRICQIFESYIGIAASPASLIPYSQLAPAGSDYLLQAYDHGTKSSHYCFISGSYEDDDIEIEWLLGDSLLDKILLAREINCTVL